MDPVLECEYGESGTGKTTDALFAIPDGIWIADKGALRTAVSVIGLRPKPSQLVDAHDLDSALVAVQKLKMAQGVLLDDISIFAQRTALHLEVDKKMKGHDLWRAVLNKCMLIFRHVRRELNSHCLVTAHVGPPRQINTAWIAGGPKFPGQAAAEFPKTCDMVLRVMKEPAREPWPFVLQGRNADQTYITKDRFNVCSSLTPMNIGEIIRAAAAGGACQTATRGAGREWMEALVAGLASRLGSIEVGTPEAATEARALLRKVREGLRAKSKSEFDINWILRDAMDRDVITRTRPAPTAWLDLDAPVAGNVPKLSSDGTLS